jgi:multisubunit Na+/H+ antiporter MnhG subunit
MGLDIRLPIGLLFSVLGLLLAVFGALSAKGIYQRSLGLNVNLGWGIVLLVFGIVMVLLGNRRRTVPDQSTAGGANHATDRRA